MPDDTDDDDDAPVIGQSEGGTMGSNLTNEEQDEIKNGGVDSRYDDIDTDGVFYQDNDDDDDAQVIEQSSGETLKSDDSGSLEAGGRDSGYDE